MISRDSQKFWWQKWLPQKASNLLEYHGSLTRIVDNIGWLVVDKAVRMGLGLVVFAWMARYLGPTQFGQLNFAIAAVAIISFLPTMGLKEIVVRGIVRDPKSSNGILGTSFFLQVIGGLIGCLLIISSVKWAIPETSTQTNLTIILSLGLLFKAADVIRYNFEAKIQSRYVVWTENAIFLIFASLKISLIYFQAPLTVFAWVIVFETALVAVGLVVLSSLRGEPVFHWRFSVSRAWLLLSESWPLAISSISIMIFMRVDQLMLGILIDEESVGIYAAAARISELWYVLPGIIVASVFPSLLTSAKDKAQFYSKLQSLYNLLISMAFLFAMFAFFTREFLIDLAYGENYSDSADILSILCFAGIFVYFGSAWTSGMVILGRTKVIMAFQVSAAIVNIILNLVLIPHFEMYGAAISTLISYGFSHTILAACIKSQNQSLRMLVQSFCFLWIPKIFSNSKEI